MPESPRPLELLAPARTPVEARQAILFGADAVYIGGPAFGARSAACNTVEDIRSVVEFARPFGVKVYVTLNTIIYESELKEVRKLVDTLYNIGVDALIVQDMALLSMDTAPIDLHASTQTDARTPEKAAMLSRAGFSQIVLPREASLDEIIQYAKAAPDASLEVFVHGALCVSYSGDCHAGAALTGRSANRGECPQICRLKYTLEDADGHPVAAPDGNSSTRYWLSLADMKRIDYLAELADAGASSFKIEGRLKDANYVLNVTRAYSQALDRVVAESDGRYCRASFGRVISDYRPDLEATFNRGYTPYFLNAGARTGLGSWNSPKWVGRPVGRMVAAGRNFIDVDVSGAIKNGDGLTFFDADGELAGFRVNRAEGRRLFAAPGSRLPSKPGTQLYRNATARDDAPLATARRVIDVSMILSRLPDGRVTLSATDSRGLSAEVVSDTPFTDSPKTSPLAHRHETLSRLGNTIYSLISLDDTLDDVFIPAKALTELRRRVLERLDTLARDRFKPRLRRKGSLASDAFRGMTFDYHANVANSMARSFYTIHGASRVDPAFETAPPAGHHRVMTTRYCLRRELGACLRGPGASRLPAQLFLSAPIGRLRLRFDCDACRMEVYAKTNSNKNK
ncbi:MAG: U32 family peptidase [Muribaculaceae bacterium]|nr:U32 family peptidase [Muribaculaceae bacterium]